MTVQIIKNGKPVRTEWSDRNPVSRHLYVYTGEIAPEGSTERASYTVPTGKKAKVHGVFCWVQIVTAATTPGRRYIAIDITDNQYNMYTVINAAFSSNNNTEGTETQEFIGYSYILLAGEKISITTYDGSDDGICTFYSSVIVTEYDEE